MTHKKINRLTALFVSITALIVYIKTIAPTVVFWDVGEFCAAAFSLQVPHPPGAPLFLLLARISSMIPLASDIAVRMHLLSALGSATACGLLYLIIVDLLVMWRGIPSSPFERAVIYGSAVTGSLSLAFSTTFWFNAVEAEVYGLSMTFIGLIILLGLRWYERAGSDSGDRYILLIAYIVGISVGVHLLSILALFPVMLLWYFRNNNFQWKSFLIFGAGALLVFLIIYPGIVTVLPSMLDGEIGGIQNKIITFIPIVLLASAVFGIYYSIRHNKRLLNVILLSFLLIVLGYSTYIVVFIRANAHPPMNENDPSTPGRLVSYLNREQYGNAPILDRRWDSDPQKKYFHKKYSSDLDYMWRYQIKHMYLRYFGWNFIGSEGDFRDAGVNWKQYYLIPFLLGLLGAYYQWRKQPYINFTLLAAFIIMGVVLALYQNQQEPQPRERDYFYVGSFFVFSIWIAYGIIAVIDYLKKLIKPEKTNQIAGCGIIALAFVLVPYHMFIVNYDRADRSGNYVAWDYSYNMLQSCEKDAILITNGDNDTFPLWYLQDVEGIRRDIRIVNLSLANAPWYIKQLKHETPYGAKKVPISISDTDIENIRPMLFEPRWMELPVSPDVIRRYSIEGYDNVSLLDTAVIRNNVLRFYMPNTIQEGNVKAIRTQDIVVYDILMTNKWERPVYFGLTVADDCKIGLREYMQLNGLTFKVVPFKSQNYWTNLNEPVLRKNLFTDIENFSKEPQYGFKWRGLQDSTIYYDEDTRRLLTANYRNIFISYAFYCSQVKKDPKKVPEILNRMEQILPENSLPIDYRLKFDIASLYNSADDNENFRRLLSEIANELKEAVKTPVTEKISQYNPYIILIYCYNELGLYKEAEDILPMIKSTNTNERGIDQMIEQLRAQIKMKQLKDSAELAAGKPGN
ncbi:MAG: DUF2723 domain-containing protein [Bacteroidetes bacterium]|nr:DUF2723 domain-containing protein [Bacteroidota bacterium]